MKHSVVSRTSRTLAIWTSALILLPGVAVGPRSARAAEAAAMPGAARLPFLANGGELDARVAFYARIPGGTVFLTGSREIVYALPQSGDHRRNSGVVIQESAVGGRSGRVVGGKPTVTQVSCFRGSDKARWTAAARAYGEVLMPDVFEGIDLTVAARGRDIEKLFTVKPGADPRAIAMRIEGGRSLAVSGAGELVVQTEGGPVTFTRPVAHQAPLSESLSPGEPSAWTSIPVDYVIAEDCYGFSLGDYDRRRPVVIDPLLASTFLGGSADEIGLAVAYDAEGNVYITGRTASVDYPTTPGAYQGSSLGNADILVSKLDASLSQLLASSIIGGSGEDEAYNVFLDAGGNVYLTGSTSSTDFPTTSGSYDVSYNGGAYDACIVKLDGALTMLLGSTYLGGSADDYGHTMAFGGADDLFLTGETASNNFPTSVGAYDRTRNGLHDAYVARLGTDLAALQAATYLGGNRDEGGNALVTAAGGDVVVAGYVASSNFPVTVGAHDVSFAGGTFDGFVSRLNEGLTGLVASTYLGSSDMDYVYSIVLDATGSILATGWTYSSTFPTTTGAYDRILNGASDVYVAKLDGSLGSLLASTFLGGSGVDGGNKIAVGCGGKVYVTGGTESSDFPVTAGAYDEHLDGSGDVIVSKFDDGLSVLEASTLLGGSAEDGGFKLAVRDGEGVTVVGQTTSSDFPTRLGSLDRDHNGGQDVFVARLDCDLSLGATAAGDGDLPSAAVLHEPVPNPFNPRTTVVYELASPGIVRLTVHDTKGRLVRRLVGPILQAAGRQEAVWDGRADDGTPMPSGVYFCRLGAGNQVRTMKMALLK